MDWSLVLVSQGIETTIDQAEDGGGWSLLVPGQDYGTAIKAIRQYHLENRGWPWQQQVFRPGFLFDWGALAWALLAHLRTWVLVTTLFQAGISQAFNSTRNRPSSGAPSMS